MKTRFVITSMTIASAGLLLLAGSSHSQGLPACPKAKGSFWTNCIGTRTYKDGEVYTGAFRNNKASGLGQSVYPDGRLYRGIYVGDKRTGPGAAIYSNGHTYRGDFVENARHGRGVYLSNAETYSGDFWKGKGTGHAVQTLENGETYVGLFKDDRRHGLGTLFAHDGTVIHSGFWREGSFQYSMPVPRYERSPDGSATRTTPLDDDVIQAHAFPISQLPHCPVSGSETWNDCYGYSLMEDGEYFGEVKNNRPFGYGVVSKDNGQIYFGHLVDGVADGGGTLRLEDGTILEGSFSKGGLSGQGRKISPDGLVYLGEFLAGKRHGAGRLIVADGEMLDGIWQNDLFKKSISQPPRNQVGNNMPAAVIDDSQSSLGSRLGIVFKEHKISLLNAGIVISHTDPIPFGGFPHFNGLADYRSLSKFSPRYFEYDVYHLEDEILSFIADPKNGRIIDVSSGAKGSIGPSGWRVGEDVGSSRVAAPCLRLSSGQLWCEDPIDKSVAYQVSPKDGCKAIPLDKTAYWITCGTIVRIAAIPGASFKEERK